MGRVLMGVILLTAGGMALGLTNWTPVAAGASAAASGPDIADQGVTILDAKETFYRWISVSRPPVVVAEDGAAERTTLAGKKITAASAGQVSPVLPAGWTDATFDDSIWPRTLIGRLADLAFLPGDGDPRGVTGATGANAIFKVGVVALRGKFSVAELTAAAQVKLSLKYRGGVVVYLNGQEVARASLPAGGITAATPGDPYPPEAYLDANGKLLPALDRIKKDDKDTADRIASRDRVLGPVALPTKALRKGVNVLAIELHRSDYHPAAARFVAGGANTVQDIALGTGWTPCGLFDLRLSAEGGRIESNARRPDGAQVWNQDCNDRATALDYGDPNEPLRPIVLAGARNGVFGGKVVVSSDQPITGLMASSGDLRTSNGKDVIRASAVEIRYAGCARPFDYRYNWMEPLSTTAPDKVSPLPALPVRRGTSSPTSGGAVVAVWTWVRVPADAAAGDYAGTLTISAGGKKLADVPVQLYVADWKLPDPRDLHTFVGLSQSSTTLALTYKVPEWSDRHWALLDRSLALLGELGNQEVQIPVVDQTRLGNDDGMVTWIKKADGTAGSFDYDYSLVERYLKMVRKHMGVPKFVVLHVYHPGGWRPAGPKQENTVTVLDAKTGQREHLQVPEFGTEEGKKFWTPVLTGLKERLAKEGMEKSLCLGSLCEQLPTVAEAKMFADILGNDVQWLEITHPAHGKLGASQRPAIPGGGRIGVHFFTYLPELPDPEAAVPSMDKDYWPHAAYFRRAWTPQASLVCFRMFAAESRFLQLPGFGHAALDYWPRIISQAYPGIIWGRWPRANGYPGNPAPVYLTWAGPDGAEPMTAYQAVREGLQETEAMVVISEALDKNAGKLGDELAGRCRQALKDELAYCRDRNLVKDQHEYYHMNHYGWQELSQRVFALAGEVTARVTGK